MTKTEKIAALIELAKTVAKDLPQGLDLQRRAIYLACSLYRVRYGNRPTQVIIDAALAQSF